MSSQPPHTPSGGILSFAQISLTGLVIGSMSVIFAISFAAIIYSGRLAPFLSSGIGLTLIGAVMLSAIGALTLSYRGTISQPQDVAAILLALTAANIAADTDLDPESAFATVALLVVLTTCLVGLTAFLLGHFRLGFIARFVPLPVINGFLAASGVLLIRGAFDTVLPMLADGSADLFAVLDIHWLNWMPWFVFGLMLAIAARFWHSPFLVPAALALALAAFFLYLSLSSLGLVGAREAKLLLGPFGTASFIENIDFSLLPKASIGALAAQLPMIITIVGLSILGMMLSATALEFALNRDLKLNKDLKSVGLANIAAGLGGGIAGYHLLGETLLARRMGIAGSAAGISVAAVCLMGLLFGPELLSSLPVGLLAAVIWYLGFDLVFTAIWDHGRKMSNRDLALVVVTPVIALIFGFLPAVGFGLLAASLLFVLAYAQVDVVRVATTGAHMHARVERSADDRLVLKKIGDCIRIYRLSGFLFFGTAHRLSRRLQKNLKDSAPPKFILVDLSGVVGLDISAWSILERLARRCGERGIVLTVAGYTTRLDSQVKRQISELRSGDFRVTEDFDGALRGIEDTLLATRQARDPVSVDLGEVPALERTLQQYGERLAFTPGEVVLVEGGDSDCLLVLISGELHIVLFDLEGRRKTINRLLPGALLGEVGYYADVPRSATVIAETDSMVLKVDRHALARMEIETPSQAVNFHWNVARILAKRLAATTNVLRDADI